MQDQHGKWYKDRAHGEPSRPERFLTFRGYAFRGYAFRGYAFRDYAFRGYAFRDYAFRGYAFRVMGEEAGSASAP